MAKEEKEDKDKKEGEGEGAKKGSKKLIIIIAAVVILVGGGAGAFFALGGSKAKEGEEGADGEEATDEEVAHEGEGEGAELPGAVVPLEVFIVNLGVKGSFLKTTIQLELTRPEPGHDFERNVPKIRDAIIRVLSTRIAQEILAPEGKEKLREDIKKAANDALGTEDITAIYFTEFIVQ